MSLDHQTVSWQTKINNQDTCDCLAEIILGHKYSWKKTCKYTNMSYLHDKTDIDECVKWNCELIENE